MGDNIPFRAILLLSIDRLVETLRSDPEKVEGILSGKKKKDLSIYAALEQASTQPDITYAVNERRDLSVLPAQHLNPVDQDAVESSSEQAAEFVNWVLQQKSWLVDALKECYALIGGTQSDFLTTFDTLSLHALTLGNLAETLPGNNDVPTWSRILSGGQVRVEGPVGKVTIPVKYLLPSSYEILGYKVIPKINDALGEEVRTGVAFKDEELQSRSELTCSNRKRIYPSFSTYWYFFFT